LLPFGGVAALCPLASIIFSLQTCSIMKNAVQQPPAKPRQLADFQAFEICPAGQKSIKGGGDIIITDVVQL
jgi:hypothetical protein